MSSISSPISQFTTSKKPRQSGFSLLEITVVLAIIGTILAGSLVTLTGNVVAKQFNATTAKMEAIHKALLNYSVANTRLPCPASFTLATTDTNYGVEAASNSNTCVGGTPAATNASATGTVEGAVPTRTLRLPDDYMYDAWGRKFRYAVNPDFTATSSFPPKTGACPVNTKNITVKDATGASRTTTATYVLMSHGADGHGGYTKAGTIYNAGSTNTDEQTNCHCDSTAVATAYAGTYVSKLPTANSSTATDVFDDIVTYRERWQLQNINQAMGTGCCDGSISVVQAAPEYGNGPVDSSTVSFNYLPTAGNSIIVFIGGSNADDGNAFTMSGGTVTDNQGNTYTRVVEGTVYPGNINKPVLYLASNIGAPSGTFTITVNPPGTQDYLELGAIEVSGLATSFAAAVDQTATGYDNPGGTTSTITLSSPTTQAKELAVALFSADGGAYWSTSGNPDLLDASSGWTAQDSWIDGTYSPRTVMHATTKILSAIETTTHSWTHADSTGAATTAFLLATFKADTSNCTSTTTTPQYLFIVDKGNNRVQKFSTDGTYISQFGSAGSGNGQFNAPQGIAIDSTGNIYVADYGNTRIQKFDSSGVYVSTLSGSGTWRGVAVDPSDNVWAVSEYGHLAKWNSAGTVLFNYDYWGTADGQFQSTFGIAPDQNGNVWVQMGSDPCCGGGRIFKYDSNGIYTGTKFTAIEGSAMAFNPNYSFLWMTGDNLGKTWQYNTSGTALKQVSIYQATCPGTPGWSDNPDGVAVGSDGKAYVTDMACNRVTVYSSGGAYITWFGSSGSGNGQFSAPRGIAIYPSSYR